MTPAQELREGLRRAREQWIEDNVVTHNANLTARLNILATHLENVQNNLGYSNNRMKALIKKQGVHLGTGRALGRTELRRELRRNGNTVPRNVVKQNGNVRWALILL